MTTAEDARDFEEVALPLIPDVSRFAYSLTRDPDEADDLVQDTYLKAFRAWHTFSPGTNVRSWLFTICKNTFRRRFRRERVRPEVEQEAVGDDDAMPTVLSHVNAERLGLGDLFDRLDVPVGTVRSRLFRARRRLQEHLIDQAIDMGIATGVGT
jgi:RNA polymerase sigma-70 factor (ECF subfamily)